jgi:glutamate formiminotransferase / 5-formyltetrahydrofolate cyclo-ligase
VLLSAPNFSEGRSERIVDALGRTLGSHARVLNVHFDAAHNRSVFTLAGDAGELTRALLAGAAHAIELIDLRGYSGLHPHIGALDVCPLIWVGEGDRAAADAAALEVAEGIGALEIPVFLYGSLAASADRRERSWFRRGGPTVLAERMKAGELAPDRGPWLPHPSAGATLVGSRPPLVAINLELDTPDANVARAVAESLRESGGGPVGVRAIGLPWHEGRSQVSVNVNDPVAVPLAEVIDRTRMLAAGYGARVVEAELVGLAPEASLRGYDGDPPIRDFDPAQHVIERVTGR